MTINIPNKIIAKRSFALSWVLIFIFIFSWFIYYSIFRSVYALKPYQQLNFYIDTYETLTGRPEQLKKLLNDKELKENGLVDISYYSFTIYNEETPILKDVIDEVDYAIVPDFILGSYVGMNDDFYDVTSLISLPNQYEVGYSNFAIKIYDKDNQEYNNNFTYSEWLSFSNDEKSSNFYLVASKYSKNFDIENNHILGYKALEKLLNNSLK